MRLDMYLAENGFVSSRTRALDLIKKGSALVNGKTVTKPSYNVGEADEVTLADQEDKYVSRAAHKLLYAKEAFGICFEGLVAADLGASTGGFCQVMLESGIDEIFAVDIGHGQLHESIKADRRVHLLEGVNARYIDVDTLGKNVDIVTADLSFISQTLVLEGVSRILKESGIYIGLIKPQFEAGRANIGKNGVVKDKRVHADVIEKVIFCANSLGLVCRKLDVSPIEGGDGNREFLAYYTFENKPGDIPSRKEIEIIADRGLPNDG